MRLTELDATFVRVTGPSSLVHVDGICEADGVLLLCPKCWVENQGPIGTHSVLLWRPRTATGNWSPGPGRWEFEGAGLEDLTLVAGSSSIQLVGGCAAHFWIRGGEIVE